MRREVSNHNSHHTLLRSGEHSHCSCFTLSNCLFILNLNLLSFINFCNKRSLGTILKSEINFHSLENLISFFWEEVYCLNGSIFYVHVGLDHFKAGKFMDYLTSDIYLCERDWSFCLFINQKHCICSIGL